MVLYEKVIKNGIIIFFVAILQNKEFLFIGLLLQPRIKFWTCVDSDFVKLLL